MNIPPTLITQGKDAVRAIFESRLRKDIPYRHWAVLKLYAMQTDDEQEEQETKHYNEVGFSSGDAQVLSRIAQKLRNGEALSPKDERELVRRLPKYWRQFIEMKLMEPPPSSLATGTYKKPTAQAKTLQAGRNGRKVA